MKEKKTSGIRTDLSPSEFQAKMDKVAPRKREEWSKVKSFFGNFSEVLSALGFLPTLKTSNNSRGHRGHGNSGGTYQSSNQSFRDTYRAETPSRRTHEDMVREHIAYDAYMDMVDGKGDHDCGHEH